MTTQTIKTEQPLVDSFFIVHTALRTSLKKLDDAIKNRSNFGKKELEAANRWFTFYWQQLASHHNGEDTYFYPAISKYDKTFIPEIDKLTDQHHQMDHLAEDLVATYNRTVGLQDGPQLKELAVRYGSLISALNATMVNHLAHEEGILFPSIEKNIPLADQTKLDTTYIRKVPMKELSLLAPWMLDNISTEMALEMRSKVPWIIRFLHDNFWLRKYKKLEATFKF